jgi:hypothetical protein
MSDTEAGLLPGELLLWTGRPARARVMPGDLVLPGVLLAALLLSVAASGPRGSVTDRFGLADQALSAAAVLAALIAATVRALRVKPAELRRTVYQVTDRRVLIATGPRRTWAAFLDQLAEPVVIPQRDGTADLALRERERFSLRAQNTWQLPIWAFIPGAQQPFPVLRGLPDADVARQEISVGRARMLRGTLDVSPALPDATPPAGFVPAPGERIVWTGCSQNDPWWFGAADIALSAYGAVFVLTLGFMVSWAASAGAPLPLLGGFTAVGVVGFGYPAAGRLLLRHARIKRSVYILTSLRLITTWAADGRTVGTESPLAQLLPPQVKDGSVFMHLAWPPPVTRRKSWDQLLWPAASTDPPQLIGLLDPRAVADLISAAQLAERARTWQLRNSPVREND